MKLKKRSETFHTNLLLLSFYILYHYYDPAPHHSEHSVLVTTSATRGTHVQSKWYQFCSENCISIPPRWYFKKGCQWGMTMVCTLFKQINKLYCFLKTQIVILIYLYIMYVYIFWKKTTLVCIVKTPSWGSHHHHKELFYPDFIVNLLTLWFADIGWIMDSLLWWPLCSHVHHQLWVWALLCYQIQCTMNTINIIQIINVKSIEFNFVHIPALKDIQVHL